MKYYHRCPKFLQTVGINIYELKAKRLRRKKQFQQWLSLLHQSETWTKKQFDDYQNQHLRRIIKHAYSTVPYYHDLYKKHKIDISKIKTKKDLEKLPKIHKDDIYKNFDRLCTTTYEPYISNFTSGTTGRPLQVRISNTLEILDKATWYRRDEWAEYDGGWIGRFVGDTPIKSCDTKSLFRKSYVMRRVFFPTYCLSVVTIPHIFDLLKRLKIEFLQCYPSAGYILAKYLEIIDSYFPLKAVFYSSEPMYDFQKKMISERFKTKTFGFYGQAEEVVSATECEHGNLHLTMIDGIMEIEQHKKISSKEEKGFTIVTSLHNYAMPLIRYALNDYTGYQKSQCSCGRTSPIIFPIETKVRDFIITPSGKIVPPPLLSFPIRQAKEIIESQFIQKSIDKITVRIVKTEQYSDSNEQILHKSLQKLLGDEVTINIEYVTTIYQTKAYKKQFIINKLGEKIFEKLLEQ